MAARSAESRLLPQAAELRKKAAADISTKTGNVSPAGVFTDLVQLHQQQRWFVKEIAH